MTLFSSHRRSPRPHEQGYVLITILLVVSLMAITALAVMPTVSFEIRRDREQEMIHRGVQYSRAIRAYYKKFGRYPTRLEDLDNTNNLRYLRKHYKDPITGQDFKLLHFGDPGLTLGGSFGGGTIPGANPIGSPAGQSASTSSNSAFGGSGFGNSAVNNSGVFSQSSSFSGNSNSAFGGTSSSQTGSPQQPGAAASASDSSASTQVAAGGAQPDASSGQQVIAAGPIVGVASVSKKTAIREFNHKKKYNEWQFLYDPTADRGGIITTPYQPPLQGFASQTNLNGQPGSSSGTSSGSSFGNSFGNSFGQPSGVSNNPNSMGAPAQPPSTTPQQQ